MHDVVVERVPDALLAPARAILVAPPRVQQAGELLDHAARHLHGEAALSLAARSIEVRIVSTGLPLTR